MKIGFLGLLTLLFVGLKLTGTIAWSWLWVLAPVWLGALVLVLWWGGLVLLIGWLSVKAEDRRLARRYPQRR